MARETAVGLLVRQLQRVPVLAHQACAGPNEQGAHTLARTMEPLWLVIESDPRVHAGPTFVEEIVMSGLGKDP